MGVSEVEAKQAFASLNAAKYMSRIPYATDVGISCLPSVNQANWRKTGLYCPEAFTECSTSLVPNMAQQAVVTYKGTPRIVTTTLSTELQLVYNQTDQDYTLAQQTMTVSVQSPIEPIARIWANNGIGVEVSSIKAQSKMSNGMTQYDIVLRFDNPNQSFLTAEAISLATSGVSVYLSVSAGKYSSSRTFEAEVNVPLNPRIITLATQMNVVLESDASNYKFDKTVAIEVLSRDTPKAAAIVKPAASWKSLINVNVPAAVKTDGMDDNGFTKYTFNVDLSATTLTPADEVKLTNAQTGGFIMELTVTDPKNGSSKKDYTFSVTAPAS